LLPPVLDGSPGYGKKVMVMDTRNGFVFERSPFTPVYQLKHYHAICLTGLSAQRGWKAQKPIRSIRLASSLHAMAQSGNPLPSADTS